ncbi:MAG TPA: Rieske 2Fe-2S domain-containing protein [Dehalococcoidia bacterium]|nr:Rieske 2Fe-2S domain-containing protein [Dehalococcoidia bacterium]
MVSENNQPEQPQGEAAPPPAQPAAPPAQAAAPAAPKSKKDMTPEERAAAIKAAQEKALRLKAEREAAKAAAGGTAVAVAEPAAPTTAGNGAVWRIPAAAGQGVTVARPDARQVAAVEQTDRQVQVTLKRRQVLRGGVFASLLGFIALSVGSFVNFFNPRHVTGFGGVVKVPASSVPKPGQDPNKIFAMKGYVVNLKPGEGGFQSTPGSAKGGILGLYQKCPHLGCTVPWRPDFTFEGSTGWFRCPCHGSTYTKGGLRVFGPAPRSMDTFDVTVNGDGSLTVNTGKIKLGSTDDPQRGKLPPA